MSEEKKVKIAFVGCGPMSTGALYPAFRLIPEADLVAVCDLKRELAERNARNFGGQRVYTDVAKMLKEEELDGAFVVGPAQMHVEVGMQCLEAGVPIYVEKPASINVEEGEKLARKADQKGLFGVVGFMKRFCHVYLLAKKLCEKKEFGGVQIFDMKFTSGLYGPIWGLESEELSFLTGMEVHAFDLARFFCGDVEEVHAYLKKPTEQRMGFMINLKFKNGIVGNINANSLEDWSTYDERVSISGLGDYIISENMLYLKYFSRNRWEGLSGDASMAGVMSQNMAPGNATQRTNEIVGHEGEVHHFIDCCRGKCNASPNLWDSVEALKIVRAVLKSVDEEKPVKVI